ncbi:hypothetical protein KJ865_02115, partial [Myxococcota bacterium]|nr:hypothetical protein [Myxococcota bacterium]
MNEQNEEPKSGVQETENTGSAPNALKGNMANRLKLIGLSVLFSGLGQVQGGHRVKGLIFLIAPLLGAGAAVVFHSPSYLYLALFMGIMTGPLALISVYALFLDYSLFQTPLFWFGIPVKLLCMIDSYFLGGKKQPAPLHKKWLVAFGVISLFTLVIFHLKFSVITIEHSSSTIVTEPGDTIIVLRNRSITGDTLNTISKAFRRGALVALNDEGTPTLVRIIAVAKDKVTLKMDGHGVLQIM